MIIAQDQKEKNGAKMLYNFCILQDVIKVQHKGDINKSTMHIEICRMTRKINKRKYTHTHIFKVKGNTVILKIII